MRGDTKVKLRKFKVLDVYTEERSSETMVVRIKNQDKFFNILLFTRDKSFEDSDDFKPCIKIDDRYLICSAEFKQDASEYGITARLKAVQIRYVIKRLLNSTQFCVLLLKKSHLALQIRNNFA